MSEDFRDLLTALVDAKVRFLIVGAHALAAHGVPRVTGDLDVWVEPTAGNARRVWNALGAFGAPLESLRIREADFATPGIVAQFGLPPYRIDVLTTISGVEFADAWSAHVAGEMWGVPVAFLGRDDFIRNKRASGRRKDLDDIAALGG